MFPPQSISSLRTKLLTSQTVIFIVHGLLIYEEIHIPTTCDSFTTIVVVFETTFVMVTQFLSMAAFLLSDPVTQKDLDTWRATKNE